MFIQQDVNEKRKGHEYMLRLNMEEVCFVVFYIPINLYPYFIIYIFQGCSKSMGKRLFASSSRMSYNVYSANGTVSFFYSAKSSKKL